MTLNRVTIIGHLGQDSELRYLPISGQPVTDFSVATDESFYRQGRQPPGTVQWHNIVVFGRLTESWTEYLGEGRQIYVEGRRAGGEAGECAASEEVPFRDRTEVCVRKARALV
jgi:single-strand DNA-binding protein